MHPSLPPRPDPARNTTAASLRASTLVIVRLRPPADATADEIRSVAERARDLFAKMPGLRRKYFSYSSERHEVVNVYEWNDGAAAALVRDPKFLARIRTAYRSEPDVTFAEVLAIADSTRSHESP